MTTTSVFDRVWNLWFIFCAAAFGESLYYYNSFANGMENRGPDFLHNQYCRRQQIKELHSSNTSKVVLIQFKEGHLTELLIRVISKCRKHWLKILFD